LSGGAFDPIRHEQTEAEAKRSASEGKERIDRQIVGRFRDGYR
jgi:hypothetical protein